MQKKKGLGRGLSALIPQEKVENIVEKDQEAKDLFEEDENRIIEVEINKIEARESQPRKHFDEKAIVDLAESIKEYGLIQPIILKKEKDRYLIVAGERRYRASKIAGLTKIPAIVKNIEDLELDLTSLIENIQREDLNGYEEAMGYKRLSDEYGLKQAEIGEKVGKSRSYIANSLRLLNLDEYSLEELKKGNLTPTQARTLLSIDNLNKRRKYLNLLLNKNTSIKEIESRKRNKGEKNIFIEEMESRYREALGTKVEIKKSGKKWKLNIEFYSDDAIEDLLRKIDEA